MNWLFWLLVIVGLVFFEAITVNLVCIWFIISAIVSLILVFLNIDFVIQFGVFVILGGILLVCTRKYLCEKLVINKEKTNLDRVVGMKGVATTKIDILEIGEVKVDGKKWSAISKNKINEGDTVIVDKIDGVKLLVRKDDI